ncbi:hypothetical protein [Variovorax sp. ZT4R33]|uniref:hypothetical protein n=1 Tax=Variovorax sp. ZT4R33 TaxID=3443743 RepID=UPI003F449DDB
MRHDMRSDFQLVAGLWICPELSEPMAWCGRVRHRVDHDAIDYGALGDFLERHFYCGEPVALRMPNDTVDHVTVHPRLRSAQPESAKCNDFAEQLLHAAGDDQSPIPVRHAWDALHRHKDRRRAPPPVLLMFLIEGTFEAVTIWHAQASMRLGIRAADLSVLLSGEMKDSDHAGQLTDELAAELERQFGVPYQRGCMLAKMVSTPPPAWATGSAES